MQTHACDNTHLNGLRLQTSAPEVIPNDRGVSRFAGGSPSRRHCVEPRRLTGDWLTETTAITANELELSGDSLLVRSHASTARERSAPLATAAVPLRSYASS